MHLARVRQFEAHGRTFETDEIDELNVITNDEKEPAYILLSINNHTCKSSTQISMLSMYLSAAVGARESAPLATALVRPLLRAGR